MHLDILNLSSNVLSGEQKGSSGTVYLLWLYHSATAENSFRTKNVSKSDTCLQKFEADFPVSSWWLQWCLLLLFSPKYLLFHILRHSLLVGILALGTIGMRDDECNTGVATSLAHQGVLCNWSFSCPKLSTDYQTRSESFSCWRTCYRGDSLAKFRFQSSSNWLNLENFLAIAKKMTQEHGTHMS